MRPFGCHPFIHACVILLSQSHWIGFDAMGRPLAQSERPAGSCYADDDAAAQYKLEGA
jgi:hypothetical protein